MRVFGDAADWASAVAAGTIESRSGSASVTPAPRRNVRRERCFLEMNMAIDPCNSKCKIQNAKRDARSRVQFAFCILHFALLILRPLHSERHTLNDARDERREAVVLTGRVANDGAHGRHVEVLDAPAQGVG